ncbi:MAG: hypothetical protein AB1486_13555 [Planctomycetota bacterium]
MWLKALLRAARLGATMVVPETARSRAWTGSLLLFIILAISLGPTVGTPFRDADYVDLDLYTRHSPASVFTTSHLRAERVHFYRPLSDFVDALMVRSYGHRPWAYHATLLALIFVNALLLVRLGRRLDPQSASAGWLAGALYVAHPLQHGTLAYFEGGCAHITYLLFTLLFLHAGLSWRATRSRAMGAGASLAVVAASLCFDGGLVLPVAWALIDLLGLWPCVEGRSRREIWSTRLLPILALVPVFVARKLVIGVVGGGYGLPLTRTFLLAFPGALLHDLGRIFYPAHPPVRAAAPFPVLPAWVWAVLLAGLFILALLRARGSLRAILSIAGLYLFLVLPATPDFVAETIQQGDFPLTGSYRLSLPMALSSLLVGLLFAAGSRVVTGHSWPAALLGVVLLSQDAVLSMPIGRTNRLAGEVADDVRSGVLDQTRGLDRGRAVFLVDTPLAVKLENLVVMRIFQFGLAAALRPPATEPEVLIYPLLLDRARTFFRPGAYEAMLERSDVTMLRFDEGSRRVVPYVAREAGAARSMAIQEPAEGERVLLRDGAFRMVFDEVAHPFLVIVNRVHPFFLAPVRDRSSHAHLEVRSLGGGRSEGLVGGPVIREIRNHFPDDPVFLYLEDFDYLADLPRRVVRARSPVLKVWLDE